MVYKIKYNILAIETKQKTMSGNRVLIPKLSKQEDLLRVGKELKVFIEKNSLSTRIGNKSYAHVDAWKFAGSCFGLTAIVGKAIRLHKKEMIRIAYAIQLFPSRNGSYEKETAVYMGFTDDEANYQKSIKGKVITREIVKPYYAYECECDIITLSNGKLVGRGTGFCSNMEATKLMFDEYSVNSTTQTRAIGKAYRNLLGYIMNEAGQESTPAEEMEEDHIKQSVISSQKSNKPLLNKSQVNQVLIKIQKCELLDLIKVEESFEITEDQRNSFEALLKTNKP